MTADETRDFGKEKVSGTITDVLFENKDNGYTVCVITDSDGEEITVVGVMPMLACGEKLTAYGKWTHHASFGRQFSAESYTKEFPASDEAIIEYLASGAVKGIGPVSAKRIVDKYGAETFEVLENHPEWLADIKGITPKKARRIGESFAAQRGIRNIMLVFGDNIGPASALKIQQAFGDAAVDIVRNNPYILCDRVKGIGFERADSIARSLGIEKNSVFRVESGIKFYLNTKLGADGNCCMPIDEVYSGAAKLLGVSREDVLCGVKRLLSVGELVLVKIDGVEMLYLAFVYRAEKYCAEKLLLLAKSAVNLPIVKAQQKICDVEAELGITFAPMQRTAIMSAVTEGLMIVTGGPGTGKTTVIRAIIKLFDSLGIETLLAAPTGRAAKRMSESTGREARTLHRLLETEFTGGDGSKFSRDEDNPLDCGALIVDEVSMTDILLLSSLLRAVSPGTKLIFIGDSDQLPPVGAGDALADMIKSGVIYTVRLGQIFRQSGDSMIVVNAHAINRGEMPKLDNKNSDFFFMPRDDGGVLCDLISTLVTKRLPEAYGFDPLRDMQVITPSRIGVAGVANLNRVLGEKLNPKAPSKKELTYKDTVFRECDKVMQIKNDYSVEWITDAGVGGEGVYNGDIGILESIDHVEEVFRIRYDDKVAKYDFAQIEEIEHAYAVTVHKSQGSEYPAVIIPVFDAPPTLLTRNMLYTAVTRAKKLVILTGRAKKIEQMVKTENRSKKYSGLAYMLRETANGSLGKESEEPQSEDFIGEEDIPF